MHQKYTNFKLVKYTCLTFVHKLGNYLLDNISCTCSNVKNIIDKFGKNSAYVGAEVKGSFRKIFKVEKTKLERI